MEQVLAGGQREDRLGRGLPRLARYRFEHPVVGRLDGQIARRTVQLVGVDRVGGLHDHLVALAQLEQLAERRTVRDPVPGDGEIPRLTRQLRLRVVPDPARQLALADPFDDRLLPVLAELRDPQQHDRLTLGRRSSRPAVFHCSRSAFSASSICWFEVMPGPEVLPPHPAQQTEPRHEQHDPQPPYDSPHAPSMQFNCKGCVRRVDGRGWLPGTTMFSAPYDGGRGEGAGQG